MKDWRGPSAHLLATDLTRHILQKPVSRPTAKKLAPGLKATDKDTGLADSSMTGLVFIVMMRRSFHVLGGGLVPSFSWLWLFVCVTLGKRKCAIASGMTSLELGVIMQKPCLESRPPGLTLRQKPLPARHRGCHRKPIKPKPCKTTSFCLRHSQSCTEVRFDKKR